MRILKNHFYCYCSGIFCKGLVMGKMFLSLSAVSCFLCLLGGFGFVFWVLLLLLGLGSFFEFGLGFFGFFWVGVGGFWRGGGVWVVFFFKGRFSCSLLKDPVRVVAILSGLFQYDYKDEKHISFFLCLFRPISHTPEKKQKQSGATKAAFLYMSAT